MVTSLNTASPARDAGTQQVQYLRKRITFSNVASTVTVGKIPAGASVVTGGVHVVTAFNATTTNVMNIGFIGATTNASAYATALTTSAVGYIVLDELAATSNIQGTVEHTVTASPSETGAASTAGTADVIVGFVLNNDV
jgi:hypothetical protein